MTICVIAAALRSRDHIRLLDLQPYPEGLKGQDLLGVRVRDVQYRNGSIIDGRRRSDRWNGFSIGPARCSRSGQQLKHLASELPKYE
jgi:hypothetical protein